jgi:hypothetical protein
VSAVLLLKFGLICPFAAYLMALSGKKIVAQNVFGLTAT